ncbi:MAG: hypothetical protein AB7F19_03805 [Candidatus Babeliales bacterium]
MKNIITKALTLTLALLTLSDIQAVETLRPIDKALLNAAKNDKTGKFVILAIEEGANVHARDEDGYTAMHWIARNADIPTLLYMLSKVDRKTALNDRKNKLGLTPYELAKLSGNTKLLNLIEFYTLVKIPAPSCTYDRQTGVASCLDHSTGGSYLTMG